MYSDFTKTDSHGNWIRAKVVEMNQQGEREEYTQLRRLTYFQLLLSAKTQKSIEILSAMPINRRCG